MNCQHSMYYFVLYCSVVYCSDFFFYIVSYHIISYHIILHYTALYDTIVRIFYFILLHDPTWHPHVSFVPLCIVLHHHLAEVCRHHPHACYKRIRASGHQWDGGLTFASLPPLDPERSLEVFFHGGAVFGVWNIGVWRNETEILWPDSMTW